MRSHTAREPSETSGGRTGSEDGLAKAIEIVVTPAIFAAAGFGLDRWWDTGPWLALSFGMVAGVGKLLIEWYRYAERMQVHERDIASSRPSARRGINRTADIDEPVSLPTGVSLESDTASSSLRGPTGTNPAESEDHIERPATRPPQS